MLSLLVVMETSFSVTMRDSWPTSAWLMSTSSASICERFGSWRSSAPNCVSISRNCWRCRSRLTACFFLSTYSSFSFVSSCWPFSSASIWLCVSAKKPATGRPPRMSSRTRILGAKCQVPGSCQLVRLNSSTIALKLTAIALTFLRGRRRRLGRGLLGAVVLGGDPLEGQVHVELGHAPALDRRGARLDQLRRLEPGGAVDVSHER